MAPGFTAGLKGAFRPAMNRSNCAGRARELIEDAGVGFGEDNPRGRPKPRWTGLAIIPHVLMYRDYTYYIM